MQTTYHIDMGNVLVLVFVPALVNERKRLPICIERFIPVRPDILSE